MAREGRILWSVQTELRGHITERPVGDFGFGYDPIFFVPEHKQTLAQMMTGEKNLVSARGKALHQLRNFLNSQ